MPSVPDRLLAIDIETADRTPPDTTVDLTDTTTLGLVAVGLGYRSCPGDPVESTVLLRAGPWGPDETATLLERVCAWIDDRPADAVITYNGRRFDEPHLRTWAETTGPTRVRRAIQRLFDSHIDLHEWAVDAYERAFSREHPGIALDRVCAWEHITMPRVRYDDFGLEHDPFLAEVDQPHVTGGHVGSFLGDAYVTASGERRAELAAPLRAYTRSDIDPLFALADSLADPTVERIHSA